MSLIFLATAVTLKLICSFSVQPFPKKCITCVIRYLFNYIMLSVFVAKKIYVSMIYDVERGFGLFCNQAQKIVFYSYSTK